MSHGKRQHPKSRATMYFQFGSAQLDESNPLHISGLLSNQRLQHPRYRPIDFVLTLPASFGLRGRIRYSTNGNRQRI